jgi:pyrophosphatase PpaX
MYSTVLFDFDGTLAPSLELWVEAFQIALSACNLQLDVDTIIRRCFHRAFDDVAADFGIASGRELERLLQGGLRQVFVKVELFPMVRELLESCKQAGFTLGLVTSSPREQVTTAFSRLNLSGYFDAVVTGNDVTHFKPHPEPVQLALSRLDRSPAETLFVGDSSMDMLAGRAAGTHTALYLPSQHSRFYDFDALRALQPNFIFTHHTELIEHLVPRATNEVLS